MLSAIPHELQKLGEIFYKNVKQVSAGMGV